MTAYPTLDIDEEKDNLYFVVVTARDLVRVKRRKEELYLDTEVSDGFITRREAEIEKEEYEKFIGMKELDKAYTIIKSVSDKLIDSEELNRIGESLFEFLH